MKENTPTNKLRLPSSAIARLGPYWTHGKTLRRLGSGEDTTTEEHKQRGLMMRGTFNGYHRHAHGRRWPQNGKGDVTSVIRTGPPPKRGGIYFCWPNTNDIPPGGQA